MLQHHSVNLGIAMNTPHGLAVPNIKAVQVRTAASCRTLCRPGCPLVYPSFNQPFMHSFMHSLIRAGCSHASSSHLLQSKSVAELAAELARLQAAAAANKLSQADVSGGTFTLSNIGTIGGTYATPLVNPPEASLGEGGMVQLVGCVGTHFGLGGVAEQK